jgi:hypothetical protein
MQDYGSADRPSGVLFSSSIRMDKENVIFENDNIYVSKEVDYQWLSEKLS